MENKTIECEEFYNLMQAYRGKSRVDPNGTVRAYQDVIDYIDKKMLEVSTNSELKFVGWQNKGNREWITFSVDAPDEENWNALYSRREYRAADGCCHKTVTKRCNDCPFTDKENIHE